MHRISSLNVTNFKAIRQAEFSFSNYSPLIGYNNAGKSSILEALSWVIKPSSIPLNGFNNRDEAIAVTVRVDGISEAVLDGLDGNHRNKIEPFVKDEGLMFRRTQISPGLAVAKIGLEVSDPTADDEWKANPAGISAALSALFPEVIFVGAMENAADDVGKNTSSSTIGKLIKQIVAPVREQYAPLIDQTLAPIAEQLSASGPNKNDVLVGVDATIEHYLNSFFPGMTAKTHIPMPEIDDILKRATIQVSEERYGDDLEGDASTMGHGAQRSVQMALINALAHIRRAEGGAEARTVLLLLDEPELYLHPQAISVVRNALKDLSSRGFQVAFTTHSGELIDVEDASRTLIVRRTPEEGCCCLRTMEDVADVIENSTHQADTLFELSNSKEFLFSDRVILVEGQTETTILPHLYHNIKCKSLLEDRVGLIRLNGSGSLRKAYEVLIAMGLESRIIADLDYAFKVARTNGLLGIADERFDEIRAICSNMAQEGQFQIGDDGYPKKSDLCSAETGFSRLAAHEDASPIIATIAEDLRENNVWIWTRGAIEDHTGIERKSQTARRQFVENLSLDGAIDNLPDGESIRSMVGYCSMS